MPFSSKVYKNISDNIFKSLSLALFQNPSPHKVYTLYPIDTGSTKKDFKYALSVLRNLHPHIAIGPLLTQNVIKLLQKSSTFDCQFLTLNANPEFIFHIRPQNVWFMTNSPLNEIKILEAYSSQTVYTLLLPPNVKEDPLISALKKTTSLSLERISNIKINVSPLSLYIPLIFKNKNIFNHIEQSDKFFGFNWINNIPTLHKEDGKFNIFQIIPKKILPQELSKSFHAYLYHQPSAIELLSYATFQIAKQLLDEHKKFKETLAYRTILGTVYITSQGFAYYDLKVEAL